MTTPATPPPPWVGKLRHTRDIGDDWGYIRDEADRLIIMVPIAFPSHVLTEARRTQTDPTQPIVDAILDRLNRDTP